MGGVAAGGWAPLDILALNSGSSSLKFGLYRVMSAACDVLLSGEVEAIGGNAVLRARDAHGAALVDASLGDGPIRDQGEAVARIAAVLAGSAPRPDAIGHRVVHGGPSLPRHCRIDDAVLRQLDAACAFAPLHTPPALAVIRFAREHFPGVAQIACFDTSFHATMPDEARVLPVARALEREGVRRYGFHGLSCESILHRLGRDPPGRIAIAHLGSGASVTAVRDGRSIDTSMGMTPTGGAIMGARSGDLDPGLLVYLLREKGYDAAMLEELVDHRSGLLGISGVSSDMRRLHEAARSSADARLALRMFHISVARQVAAMIVVLGGLDLLVFTGGIGENDPDTRAAVCDRLSWMGVRLDDARNRAGANPLSAPESRCAVQVLASEEDRQIARHAWALCA